MCAIHENIGLTEVVSVVWCLLLVGPYGMSAPIKNDAYWVDPCGGHPVGDGAGGDRRSDGELLDAILMPATRALNKAKTYAESFVNAISIKVDGREISRTIEDLDKDFPEPAILKEEYPRKYGVDTPTDHYQSLIKHGLGRVLLRHYSHLQELAIALNAVVEDRGRYGSSFYDEFNDLKGYLKQVLCETLTGINELGLGEKIVNRTGPVEQEPVNDETFRIVRDFKVLREYILYMEYLIQGIQFFKQAGLSD